MVSVSVLLPSPSVCADNVYFSSDRRVTSLWERALLSINRVLYICYLSICNFSFSPFGSKARILFSIVPISDLLLI